MTVEPKSGNRNGEMTSEEAQMALDLIRALEAQVRNLERQIADINKQVGRQSKSDDRCPDNNSEPKPR